MAQTSFVDFGLHLNRRAWAVLHMLDREPDFAPYDDLKNRYEIESETYAFYNGRERGFTVRINHPDAGAFTDRYLYVVFAECRTTDDVVIFTWVGPRLINPPGPNDLSEEVWKARVFAKSVEEAAREIQRICKDFLQDEVHRLTAREVMES